MDILKKLPKELQIKIRYYISYLPENLKNQIKTIKKIKIINFTRICALCYAINDDICECGNEYYIPNISGYIPCSQCYDNAINNDLLCSYCIYCSISNNNNSVYVFHKPLTTDQVIDILLNEYYRINN
jgi:hypothetical protein